MFRRVLLGPAKTAIDSLGWLFGVAGAPTMEMGGQTMVGRHGGSFMHGPMLMAGKIDVVKVVLER